MFLYVSVLCVYCVCDHVGQERVPDVLNLELRVAVRHLTGAGH